MNTGKKQLSAPAIAAWLAVGRALASGRAWGQRVWESPRGLRVRRQSSQWLEDPRAGSAVLIGGIIFFTLLIAVLDKLLVPLPNPGMVYLPLVAMLAYHWNWTYALLGGVLEILCVYLFFIPPPGVKSLTVQTTEQLLTLAAVTGFVLALVALARNRRAAAEHEAGRFAALNQVGAALTGELDEPRLLRMIAETARNLTGAGFAAFTLRPVDPLGQPAVPSEGSLFHLAAVVGVTPEQEDLFRRVPLGGEGLLAPIFRHGVPVRVADALEVMVSGSGGESFHGGEFGTPREEARSAARAYAEGRASKGDLRSLGVPQGHPVIRSFLGAPLLDRNGEVRGGLLLGHSAAHRFTQEDEALLVGLAAQASVALENARLYHAAQTQARELDAIFESIEDGIAVVDASGGIVRENSAARRLHEALASGEPSERAAARQTVRDVAAGVEASGGEDSIALTVPGMDGEEHTYVVSASRLIAAEPPVPLPGEVPQDTAHAVVVWHDVTEARRLLEERRAHAAAEAQRRFLETVLNELPSAVYLVRGRDARLVVANKATAGVWGGVWREGQPLQGFLDAIGTRVFGVDGKPLETDDLATVRAVRAGGAVRHHQEVIRHRDGSQLPALVNAVTVQPAALHGMPAVEDGSPEPAAIVVIQDVTALKEAERIKDEFISIAAHELRNPMAAIKGYAQMLTGQMARGRGQALEDWQREALEAIDSSTSRLVELTEDLLDVTRLQAGRLELSLEPANLAALARRTAARLHVTTERHTLTVCAEPEHIVSLLDTRRMEQVLTNLLNNAIKYSPNGGTILVTVTERLEAGIAELTVRDQGIGIPAEQQSRIFGRFARAENAKAQGITGTGLGLYLSRELVERHGGRIWFESVEGEGTTFHVTVPLADLSEELGAS